MRETKSDVHETARAPHKAGATGQAAPHEFDHLSVRQALCLFLDAYQYPHLGNEDARESLRLEEEARALSAYALPDTSDPPEFTAWLSVLTDPRSRVGELETVYFAMLDDGPAFGLPVRN